MKDTTCHLYCLGIRMRLKAYKETTSEKWDNLCYTTRKGCTTILYRKQSRQRNLSDMRTVQHWKVWRNTVEYATTSLYSVFCILVFNLYIPVQRSQIVRKPKMLRGELKDSYLKGSGAFEISFSGAKYHLRRSRNTTNIFTKQGISKAWAQRSKTSPYRWRCFRS